jgi:hypothetical protein
MFKLATSRVPHSRGGETFQTVAEAAAAVATLPGVTLADIVAVPSGLAGEDEAAWKALEAAKAAKAAQAERAKAAEDAAKVVAIAADLAAREAKAKRDAALDAVAADKIATDLAKVK